MNDTMISQFIDNELDLRDKVTFVSQVNCDDSYAKEAVELLEQEQLLRKIPQQLTAVLPPVAPSTSIRSRSLHFIAAIWQPVAGFAVAIALIFLLFPLYQTPNPGSFQDVEQRFVIYLPESSQAKIIGTFTDWEPIAMHRIGKSGYWSLTISVPFGEHRYSFLLDDGVHIADPSIIARERDDFGGENSVIVIGEGGNHAPVS